MLQECIFRSMGMTRKINSTPFISFIIDGDRTKLLQWMCQRAASEDFFKENEEKGIFPSIEVSLTVSVPNVSLSFAAYSKNLATLTKATLSKVSLGHRRVTAPSVQTHARFRYTVTYKICILYVMIWYSSKETGW